LRRGGRRCGLLGLSALEHPGPGAGRRWPEICGLPRVRQRPGRIRPPELCRAPAAGDGLYGQGHGQRPRFLPGASPGGGVAHGHPGWRRRCRRGAGGLSAGQSRSQREVRRPQCHGAVRSRPRGLRVAGSRAQPQLRRPGGRSRPGRTVGAAGLPGAPGQRQRQGPVGLCGLRS
ncbi:hypothetical protein KXX11_004140, partial [Aspergillus fumigatus]